MGEISLQKGVTIKQTNSLVENPLNSIYRDSFLFLLNFINKEYCIANTFAWLNLL